VFQRQALGKADMAWYLTRMKCEEEEVMIIHISRHLALEAGLVAEAREEVLIRRDMPQKGQKSDSMDQVNLVQDMTMTGTRGNDDDDRRT
jgi:hypothetical protein